MFPAFPALFFCPGAAFAPIFHQAVRQGEDVLVCVGFVERHAGVAHGEQLLAVLQQGADRLGAVLARIQWHSHVMGDEKIRVVLLLPGNRVEHRQGQAAGKRL